MPEAVPLILGTTLIAVAAAWAVARALSPRVTSERGPEAVLGIAAIAIVVFLVWRGARSGSFPATDLGETFAFLTLTISVAYLVLVSADYRALGVFVLPAGLVFAIVSTLAILTGTPGTHGFETFYLVVHTTSSLCAYAALVVGAGASTAYLIQERALRRKSFGRLSQAMPSLSDLDALSYRAVALGFPLLTLGIVMGSVWASQRWGSFWFWELKLTLSLLLWLAAAAIFHLRTIEKHQGRRTAILTIVAALLVVIVLVAPVLLRGGRHAFL